MTHEEQEALKDIQGTAGYRVIQSMLEQSIKKLDLVSTLDEHSETPVLSQALGRKYAVEALKGIYGDLGISIKPTKEINKTYE